MSVDSFGSRRALLPPVPWPSRSPPALARSLVPPSSRVIAEVEGECVELAPSPSCVHIYFTGSRGEEDPADVLRQAARAHGRHVAAVRTPRIRRVGRDLDRFHRQSVPKWSIRPEMRG